MPGFHAVEELESDLICNAVLRIGFAIVTLCCFMFSAPTLNANEVQYLIVNTSRFIMC